MSFARIFAAVITPLCLTGILTEAAAQGTETFQVTTASGRVFKGTIGPRTNQGELWLVTSQPTWQVERPVSWSAIQRVRSQEQELALGTFRDAAIASAAQARSSADAPRWRAHAATAPSAMPQPENQDVVPTSLHVAGHCANWDADAENDGILLEVVVRDAQGNAIVVAGVLEVELNGERWPYEPNLSQFCQLGRWSLPISEQDFAVNRFGEPAALVRLPFDPPSPDMVVRTSDFGEIDARMSLAAVGTLAAQSPGVVIREWNPLRLDRFLYGGVRFGAHALTGVGVSATGPDRD